MTRQRAFLVVGLLVAFLLAGIVSGFASSSPDGLEKVAEDKGFVGTAKDHPLAGSPVADYGVSGVDDERLGGGLAGVIGVVVTLSVGGALFLALRRRGASAAEAPPAADAGGTTAGR